MIFVERPAYVIFFDHYIASLLKKMSHGHFSGVGSGIEHLKLSPLCDFYDTRSKVITELPDTFHLRTKLLCF